MTSAVADADLHAFLDGELNEKASADVRRHVAANSDAAGRIERWRADRDVLRARLAPAAKEAVPLRLQLARLEPTVARDREARRMLRFALGFIAGFLLGLGVAALIFLAPRFV